MKITVVCEYCRENDKDPVLELNYKEKKLYYLCPKCKKENVIKLQPDIQPLPRIRRM